MQGPGRLPLQMRVRGMFSQVASVRSPGWTAASVQEEAHTRTYYGGELLSHSRLFYYLKFLEAKVLNPRIPNLYCYPLQFGKFYRKKAKKSTRLRDKSLITRLRGKQHATRPQWNNWFDSTSRKPCPSSRNTSLSCQTLLCTLMQGNGDDYVDGDGDGASDGD